MSIVRDGRNEGKSSIIAYIDGKKSIHVLKKHIFRKMILKIMLLVLIIKISQISGQFPVFSGLTSWPGLTQQPFNPLASSQSRNKCDSIQSKKSTYTLSKAQFSPHLVCKGTNVPITKYDLKHKLRESKTV